ncbi:MAG: O-antigen polymerase [Bacteroidota bacterium]
MTMASWACFLAGGLILTETFVLRRDLLSPGRLFSVLWFLVIGLTDLKLSRFQHEWSAEAWVYVLLGPCSFLLGIFIAYVVHMNKPLLTVREMRNTWRNQIVIEPRLFVSVVVAFLLFVGAFLFIRYVKGVPAPLFSKTPGITRAEFTVFGLGLFLHNVVIILFFTVTYHLLVRGNNSRKWILKILSGVSVILYFFLLQRFELFLTIVACTVLLHYATHRLRPRVVVLYSSFIVLLFYWVSTLRSGLGLFIYYLYQDSRMRFPPKFAILTEPYMYIAMNLENFARGVEKIQSHTFGYYSFDFLLAVTGLKHPLATYFGLDDTPFLISGYNTYSGFWVYERDFGILGVVFIPVLLGLGAGWLYYALRRTPTLYNLGLYGLAVFAILFSFFNNPLSFLWFMYTVAGMIVIIRFVQGSTKREARLGEVPE